MGIFEEIDENEIWRLGEKGRQKGERGGVRTICRDREKSRLINLIAERSN